MILFYVINYNWEFSDIIVQYQASAGVLSKLLLLLLIYNYYSIDVSIPQANKPWKPKILSVIESKRKLLIKLLKYYYAFKKFYSVYIKIWLRLHLRRFYEQILRRHIHIQFLDPNYHLNEINHTNFFSPINMKNSLWE